jgi:opacity protein-like surface antigen
MTRVCLGGALVLLSAAVANAQPVPGAQGWSVLSGQTVGAGATVVDTQFGYPGISFGLLHGVNEGLDLGAAVDLNYSLEGSAQSLAPGFKLQGLLRVCFVDTPQLNFGLQFAPGPFFAFFHGGRYGSVELSNPDTFAGFSLPVSLVVGIPIGSAMMLNAGIDVPFFLYFGPGAGAVVPILAGAGLEYFVSQHLSLSFNTRVGPTLAPYNYAYVSFEGLLGVAYRL